VRVDDESIDFDLASVDVGSEAAHLDVPGARDHAWSLRPMTRVKALRDRLDVVLTEHPPGSIPIGVVGAGAAGVEVALALEERVARAGRVAVVTLFNAGPTILPDYIDRFRERAGRILEARGIRIRVGHRIDRVEADAVVDASGARTESALTVWLTGAAPPAILERSALPRDPHGFFLVDDTLRSADGEPIWGAGDCIGIQGHPPLAKAGVYAVRESPIVDRNIRAYLSGGTPTHYEPQAGFLALLNTADGKALLRWKGLVSHSRWAWWLKDRIDRGFMARYTD
jgi:selenide,water dikinase